MPRRYRPLARPSEFYYIGGYMFTAVGMMLVGIGLVRLEWQYFAYGFPSLIFAVLNLAGLAWWRERFDSLNPEDVDTEITRLERVADRVSLRIVRSVVATFRH